MHSTIQMYLMVCSNAASKTKAKTGKMKASILNENITEISFKNGAVYIV